MADQDLGQEPWVRLAKLAPPATSTEDLQVAANRWAHNQDLYNAAADLWEDLANQIDIVTGANDDPTAAERIPTSVTQDGIRVEYQNQRDPWNARVARRSQFLAQAEKLRSKGKPYSPLMHSPDYDAWRGINKSLLDSETVIELYPDDVIP